MSESESIVYSSDQFPAIDRSVWLNHAAISPWPRAVIRAMSDFIEQNALHGPAHYAQWLATEQRLRRRSAQLLNAESDDDIALVKNTSDGLNLIANGLEWQHGDAVICCAGDFPSNRLPWCQLKSNGVDVREIELDGPDNCLLEDPESRLIEALDSRVRLMAVSSVHYDSGLKLDLDRLGQACRCNGTLLAVDAIQHIGALELDVQRQPVDFVVAGSHKWLMSPEGLALFWSKPEARRRIRQSQYGWRMWHDPFNFEREDWQPPTSARRFEPGTLNMAGIHGLNAALGLLLELDLTTTANALLARTDYLLQGLSTIPGVRAITPARRQQHAGIVSFEHTQADANKLLEWLKQADIHAAKRGHWVRLSPHFYTPFEQLDDCLDRLDRFVRAGTKLD